MIERRQHDNNIIQKEESNDDPQLNIIETEMPALIPRED